MSEATGRPFDSAAGDDRRRQGLELYLTGNDGRPMALRKIAEALNVTLRTVQYWRKEDSWDLRAREALNAKGSGSGAVAVDREAVLKEHMAARLLLHVKSLDAIIRRAKAPQQRIAAVRAYVDIFRKLGGSLDAGKAPSADLPFKDDLGG